MSIGWGLIGAGVHAGNIMAPAINQATDARLTAVCSRSAERAEAFARQHKAARAYTSYEELLRDPAVDMVYIATPNALHPEQTRQAAKAGKHVLCEKPMALTVSDAQDMIAACRKAGVRLGVALQNRFHPAHQEIRRQVLDGRAGELLLLLGEYSRDLPQPAIAWKVDPELAGGGAVMGLGTHVLDLFRYISGQNAVEVQARTDNPAWGDKVDDLVLAILTFPGKLRASMVSGYYVPRATNSVITYGSRTRYISTGTVGRYFQGALHIERQEGSTNQEFTGKEGDLRSYVRMVDAFMDSVKDGCEPIASGQDGLELVRMVDAVLESGRTGRAVLIRRPRESVIGK